MITHDRSCSFSAHLRAIWLVMGLIVADSSQCQEWRPPMVDRTRFKPAAGDQRILNTPIIKLVSRADAAQFCSGITGIPINAQQQPMACAYWNISRQECTIVTPYRQ